MAVACLSLLTNCQKNSIVTSPVESISLIIEKHNEQILKLPQKLPSANKDLLIAAINDVYQDNLNQNSTLQKIQLSENYYESYVLSYMDIVRKTNYSLDSLGVKDNYTQRDLTRLEKCKNDLSAIESQIVNIRTRAVLIGSGCKKLMQIRKDCDNLFVNGELTFKEVKCEEEFNEVATTMNGFIKDLNQNLHNLQEVDNRYTKH